MNNLLKIIVVAGLFVIASCNNKKKKDPGGVLGNNEKVSGSPADSLMEAVMDGHNIAMAKYGRLKAMQNEVKRRIDSIGQLPSKIRQASATLENKLLELDHELNSARESMDKWMEEFNMDSAVNNAAQRIKYLTEEKIKVGKVKEAVLSSLQKADSVFSIKH